MRPATAARLVLGSVALAYPSRLLGAVGGLDRGDPGTGVVVRVLGGRLLAQGLADLALGRRTRVPDVVIDVTHAASMVLVAGRWPEHRRSALVSAAVASAIALLDLRRS